MWEAGVGNAQLVEVGVPGELMHGRDLRLPAEAPELGSTSVGVQHVVGSAAVRLVSQNRGVRDGFYQPRAKQRCGVAQRDDGGFGRYHLALQMTTREVDGALLQQAAASIDRSRY